MTGCFSRDRSNPGEGPVLHSRPRGQTSLHHLLGSGFRSGLATEWLKLGGVKFSIDGSGAFGNAMVYEPYPGRPDDFGLQRVDTEEFIEAVRLSHEGGLQIACHAIGQRAVDLAMDAFAALDATPEELERQTSSHRTCLSAPTPRATRTDA